MLHWIRWREPKSGVTSVESVEVKAACLLLRDGGGWQECIEIGGPSTVGIAKVNLKLRTIHNHRNFLNLFLAKALASLDVNVIQKRTHLTLYIPFYDVTELFQPVLNAVDGLPHSLTVKPVVVFVLPLCIQTAALA